MADDRDTRIAELERENGRLRRLLAAQNVPSALRHQVRNSLALMRAILRQSAETSASVEDYAAHTEGRFDALLRVQTLLIAALDEGVPLSSLVADELVACAVHEGQQAKIEGPPVLLGQKSAQLLALAFHELAVNAIKFGALATSLGRVSVSWSLNHDAEEFMLIWKETGTQRLSPPSFRGFGIDTLENMLRYELLAEITLEFRPEGLHYAVKLPVHKLQK